MSETSKRFLIAYIFLVALPLLGLVGVLKHGQNLSAPISIDGTWKLQMEAGQVAALPCGQSLVSSAEPAMTISQSGRNFTLTFSSAPKIAAAGTVDGTAIKASVPAISVTAEDCKDGLNLVASIDAKAEPRELHGTLSAGNCPSCSSVQLVGTREAQAHAKRSH
jgi:hypothetical protein